MVILMNLCIHHGIALTRWKNITNTMIEKVTGVDKLDRLRMIHLLQADFNMILGILWSQRMMKNAREHKALSPYQWARSGSHATDPLLLKTLSFEIAGYTRTSLSEMDLDAASCYD